MQFVCVFALCLGLTVAQLPTLCNDMETQHIKDLKIDDQGQLFFIDIANKIYAMKPNCGERKLIYSDTTILPNNVRIRIPTSLTIGHDELGRRGIFVSNFVPPAPLLFFLEFDFETLTILDARALSIDATYVSEISTAPNGDLFAVDQQQSILRFNILTGETSTFLEFNSGIVDIFDLATSQECPVLYISANDNDEVWRCKDLASGESCVPFTSEGLHNPWGLAVDCKCQLFVASHTNGNLKLFSPPNTVRSELQCAYEAELVEPGVYINSDGALDSDTTDGRVLFRFPRIGSFWLKTRCETNSSWIVNGESYDVPPSGDFVWHEFGTPSGTTNFFPLVSLQVGTTGCEIAQVFMGSEGGRLSLGLLNRECASAYLCASEFCTNGETSIVDVPNQGPALNSTCSTGDVGCETTFAQLVFEPAIFASGAHNLYLETSCLSNGSDAWAINGREVTFPLTEDFTWHEAGLVTSSTVLLTPAKAGCRVRGAFLAHSSGSASTPTLPYPCTCCVKETTVYYTMFGDIFAATIDGTIQKCNSNFASTVLRDVQVNDVAVTHSCKFQPTLPPSQSPSPSFTPTGTPTRSITPTESRTQSSSPTVTRTQSSTVTSTRTRSSSSTATQTQSSTPTVTRTQSSSSTGTRTQTSSSSSSPTQSPTSSSSPSHTPTATPSATLRVTFSIRTVFANGHDTGGASQGNQNSGFRTFQSGEGLVLAIVLLQTIGTSTQFVRFVDTDSLGLSSAFPITSRFRLYTALGSLRLAECPTHVPVQNLSAFLKERIRQLLVGFTGSPTDLDTISQKSLFLSDTTGIECIPPQLVSTFCDPSGNAVPTRCYVPNVSRFTWGVVWDPATDQPCIIHNGVTVCMEPFSSATNPVFVGLSSFRSQFTDPVTSLPTTLPLTAQVQVVRGLFPECSTTKVVAPGSCPSALVSAEQGSGRVAKSANFCFQPPLGFQNTCGQDSPSEFGCFCDECCLVFGDCCPDVQFCLSSGILGGECRDAQGNVVATQPSCVALCSP